MNAKLVEYVGVGVEVKRDKKGRLEREEITKMIKHVICHNQILGNPEFGP